MLLSTLTRTLPCVELPMECVQDRFPSRMTIGMLIESMSGKSTALGGKFCDSSSFAFNKTQRAIDLFARELTAAGYTYFGSEPAIKQRIGVNSLVHTSCIGILGCFWLAAPD